MPLFLNMGVFIAACYMAKITNITSFHTVQDEGES